MVEFGHAAADDIDQVAPMDGVAKKRTQSEERAAEAGCGGLALDIANQERGFVGLAEVEFKIAP